MTSAVDQHRDEHNDPEEDVDPIALEADQQEPGVDHGVHECAEHRAQHAPVTAGQQGAADDGHRDGDELPANASVRVDREVLDGHHDPGDARREARHGEYCHRRASDRHAEILGGGGILPDCEGPVSHASAQQEQRRERRDHEEPHNRHPIAEEQLAGDQLGVGSRKLHHDRKAAGIHCEDAAIDERGRERDDEGGQSGSHLDNAVERAEQRPDGERAQDGQDRRQAKDVAEIVHCPAGQTDDRADRKIEVAGDQLLRGHAHRRQRGRWLPPCQGDRP